MPQLQPPVPPNALENAFSRVMQYNPRCMQTTFQFLSVHDRILLRTVAPFLSDLVHDPALWYHVVYVHDGIQSSKRIAPPTSPFTHQAQTTVTDNSDKRKQESNAADVTPEGPGLAPSTWHLIPGASSSFTISSDGRPSTTSTSTSTSISTPILPPRWLRSLVHELILRELTTAELPTIFTAWSSIRHITIDSIDIDDSPEQTVKTIRASFSVLRLESLTIQPFSKTLQIALLDIPEEGEAVGILSQAETLTRLNLEGGLFSTSTDTFLLLMKTMSHRQWSRLASFIYFQPLPPPNKEFEAPQLCARAFSHKCMPVLQHLSVQWAHESNESIEEFMTLKEHDPDDADDDDDDIELPYFAMSHQLSQLTCGATVLWSGIPAACQGLTTLILIPLSMRKTNIMRTGRDLFEMIGHHNLPHLAILSVTSHDEPIVGDNGVNYRKDHDRVLELMSAMVTLTSLHSNPVNHNPMRANSFNWFCHLYRFSSLKNLAFLTIASPHAAYRNVPLPLPAGIKLTSNQHLLYPDGGIHLVYKAESPPVVVTAAGTDSIVVPTPPPLPEWLNADNFRTIESKHKKEEIQLFGLPDQPTIVYLDTHKFREGGNTKQLIKKADQSCNVQMDIIDSSGTKNILTGVFTTVMTQLCMVTMLSHLTILERGFMMRVSRHFYHSVLHSALWKNVTYHATSDSGAMLPSPQICDLIGGLKVSSSTGSAYNRILSLPSLRRLTLETLPGWDVCEREICTALSQFRLDSLSLHLDIRATQQDPVPRMFGAIFGLTQVWSTETNKKVENADVTDSIIWSYADSLRHLDLMVQWCEGSYLRDRMSDRVWSQLHTLKLNYRPSSLGLNELSIPFEELLVQSGRVLPNLTDLDFECMTPDRTFDRIFSLFKRIFIAIAKSNTITTLRHSIGRLFCGEHHPTQPMGMLPIYPLSLTSLTIEQQTVEWEQISRLKSLTELQLKSIKDLTGSPIKLFQFIGAHRLPHLARLSMDCPTFTSIEEAECKHQTEVVLDYMSKMTALTELRSECVDTRSGEPKIAFNWFAHAYAFPSLKRIQYNHTELHQSSVNIDDFTNDNFNTSEKHTLMKPKSTASSVLSLSNPHLLPPFYNPSSPHHDHASYYSHPPPSASFHVFIPTRVLNTVSYARGEMHNICIQEEYQHLSQEELRIVQQRMMEKNGGSELQFHDNRFVSKSRIVERNGNSSSTLPQEETFTLTRNDTLYSHFMNVQSNPFASPSEPTPLAFVPDDATLQPGKVVRKSAAVRADSNLGPPVLAALPQSTFSAAAAAATGNGNNGSGTNNPFASAVLAVAPPVALAALASTVATVSSFSSASSSPSSSSSTPFIFQFAHKPSVPQLPQSSLALAAASAFGSSAPTTTAPPIFASEPSSTSHFSTNSTYRTDAILPTPISTSGGPLPFVFQFGGASTASTTIASDSTATTAAFLHPLAAPTTSIITSSTSSSQPTSVPNSFASASTPAPFVFQFGSKSIAATATTSSTSISISSSSSSTSTFALTSTSTSISPFTFASLYSSTLPASSSSFPSLSPFQPTFVSAPPTSLPSVIAAASSSSSLSSPHSSNPTPTSPFVFQFGSKPTSTVAPTSSASSTITSLPSTFGSMPSLSSSSSSSSPSSLSSLSSGFVFQFGSK